jgi:hypothetical protein
MSAGVRLSAGVTRAVVEITTNGYVTTPVSDLATGPNSIRYDMLESRARDDVNGVEFDTRENLNSGANTTKFVGRRAYGRDTTNARKEIARERLSPLDANWVNSSLSKWVRIADTITEAMRLANPAAGETAAYLLTNRGGVLALQRVLEGGAGTGPGGSGRALYTA